MGGFLMKKTKVVCSIGPSSNSMEVLREMIKKGMDVARFDLGMLPYSFCSETIDKIHKLEDELDCTVGILFENRGPELRLGTLSNGKIVLQEGDLVSITGDSVVERKKRFPLIILIC